MSKEWDEIESRLRFLTSIESVLRTVGKEFSLCFNHLKGHGELFCKCIDSYHPGALLFLVKIESWYLQGLSVEVAGAV